MLYTRSFHFCPHTVLSVAQNNSSQLRLCGFLHTESLVNRVWYCQVTVTLAVKHSSVADNYSAHRMQQEVL